MTVFLCSAVNALDVTVKTPLKGTNQVSQASELRLDTAKILGLSRKKAHDLLGQPKRSEEFFPYSHHSTVVEYYDVKAGSDEHLRLSYDRDGNVSAADVEPSPYMIPKFMAEKVSSVNLTDIKLRSFLNSMPENQLRNLSAEQMTAKLGKPDRAWNVTSRAGGREWHFLNQLYYLSENGRRAFIVMFDEASNSVYEYRLQSLSN